MIADINGIYYVLSIDAGLLYPGARDSRSAQLNFH
jgi:hypothetical protein